MKFHPPHVSPKGHSYSIDDHGLAVQIDIGNGPQTLTGEEAQHLREWLSKAELRTQEQHEALEPAPAEVNPGIKIEMNDATVMKDGRLADDGTHQFATTEAELATLQATAKKNRDEQLALIAARTKPKH